MTLDPKVQVELPSQGVIVRRSGKHPTVYKVTETFRTEDGKPDNRRVGIGKYDSSTGMLIPNPKYFEFYGDGASKVEVMPAFNTTRCIGGAFLIDHILTSLGVSNILAECFDRERASLIHTSALYMASRGNVFEGVLDFCEDFTYLERPLASSSASELFASITWDERMEFFKKWVNTQNSLGYLAYDVTSFSTYAKGIVDAEFGHNRDGEKLPQINLGCYLSESSGLPIFYVTYPGSIVDKSHLKNMMAYNKDLSISEVVYVLDFGFCSVDNIKYLSQTGFKYLLHVDRRYKETMAVLDNAREGILTMQNLISDGVYGVSKKGNFYGVNGTMHVFCNPKLAEDQRKDLYRLVESKEELLIQHEKMSQKDIRPYKRFFSIYLDDNNKPIYNRDYIKIQSLERYCGFFCIFTELDLTASQVLTIYRNKDLIEKCFDDVKNHIDMKRLRTHNSKTTDGKLFCSFISLIAVTEMMIKLRTIMRKKGWSKNSVFRDLEKIRIITTNSNKRLENHLTKRQRIILDTFNIGEKEIEAYLARAN
ncbi:MAG: transposase [Deltaproteobacteria bacterium]|jgi:transposase|nr:transposase [Deltaproteobacteria bacterium]